VAALHLVVPNFFQGVCELVHTCAPSRATNSKKGRCQDTTEHRPYHLKSVHWGRAGQQTVNWPRLLKRRRNAGCTAGRALWPLRQRLPADAGSKSLESRPLRVRGGACATSFQVATDRRRGKMNIDVGKLGSRLCGRPASSPHKTRWYLSGFCQGRAWRKESRTKGSRHRFA